MTKRTAAETTKNLRKKLLRLAHENPESRTKIFPILARLDPRLALLASKEEGKKQAGAKVAIAKDTEDFIRWVVSTQGPMSSTEVEAFVSRTLGIKTSPPVKKRTGSRFQRGDSVLIKAGKHTAAKFDRSNYDRFDGKIGTVTEVDGSDAMVAFKGERADVRFPGAQSPRGVGIYKYTKPYTITGSSKIEMIYNAGGKATPDQKVIVDAYRGRGRETEKRPVNYYTGHVVMASTGANGYYFRGFPQQRLEVDPQSEAGFQARTFNPAFGEVLYIGIMNSRPSNWKAELERMDEELAAFFGE